MRRLFCLDHYSALLINTVWVGNWLGLARSAVGNRLVAVNLLWAAPPAFVDCQKMNNMDTMLKDKHLKFLVDL